MLRLPHMQDKAYWFLFSPFLIMVFFSIGRGLGNTSLFLYTVAGVFLLPKVFREKDFGLYVFILYSLVFFGAAVVNENDLINKSVVVFWLSSLSYLYALYFSGFRFGLSSRSMLISILLVGLIPILFDYWTIIGDDSLSVATHVSVMVLAVIFPIVFLFKRKDFFVILIVVMSALLLFAESRTEVLAVLISIAFYFCFLYRKMRVLLFSIVFVVLVSVIVTLGFIFSEGGYETLLKALSHVSSKRTDLWIQALLNPPENMLLGGGLGNSADVISSYAPKHLHSLVIEMWWEIGVLGVLSIFLLTIYSLSSLVFSYKEVSGDERKVVSVLGACYTSLVTVCLLDKGFNSVFFSFFYFALLGTLYSVCKGFIYKSTTVQFQQNEILGKECKRGAV